MDISGILTFGPKFRLKMGSKLFHITRWGRNPEKICTSWDLFETLHDDYYIQLQNDWRPAWCGAGTQIRKRRPEGVTRRQKIENSLQIMIGTYKLALFSYYDVCGRTFVNIFHCFAPFGNFYPILWRLLGPLILWGGGISYPLKKTANSTTLL